ncbi:hypothetical protein JCM24511_01007 [Saitozyma sp. JCM 24511]|nr:hypothetical protein JCM24511_01007 [Saitozyma sp. JCM 24511]
MAPAANPKSSKASVRERGDSRRRKCSSKAGDQADHTRHRESPRTRTDKSARRSSASDPRKSDIFDNANDTKHLHLSDKQRQATISTLYELISRTKPSGTICPSQVSRALHSDDKAQFPDWRELMDPVREVVWEEVRRGRVEVTQGGDRREWEKRKEIKGPIRIRRGPRWDERCRGGDDDDGEEEV